MASGMFMVTTDTVLRESSRMFDKTKNENIVFRKFFKLCSIIEGYMTTKDFKEKAMQQQALNELN